MKNEVVLKVENFGVSFLQYTQGLDRQSLNVITDLDLELHAGEILAVVGSSGSGKSLLAHGILGILPANAETSGTIYYRGHPLTQTDKETLRGNKIALIPQSVNYLDPLERVGRQIGISLVGVENEKERRRIVCALMEKYGLGSETYDLYPHQLSGGMARRVLLCTALASDCEIIIADEPTPGLDEASLQEVLCDFRRVADIGKAVLMITHDIHAACAIADRLAIFYAGSTLEIAGVQEMRGAGEALRHPYTKALLRAMPGNAFEPVSGTQPMPGKLPAGCLFSDRCGEKTAECEKARPGLRELRGGKVRCFHAT